MINHFYDYAQYYLQPAECRRAPRCELQKRITQLCDCTHVSPQEPLLSALKETSRCFVLLSGHTLGVHPILCLPASMGQTPSYFCAPSRELIQGQPSGHSLVRPATTVSKRFCCKQVVQEIFLRTRVYVYFYSLITSIHSRNPAYRLLMR